MRMFDSKQEKEQFDRDCIEVDKFRKQGHSMHCACRIVWGDGCCTCTQTSYFDLNKKSIIDKVLSFICV